MEYERWLLFLVSRGGLNGFIARMYFTDRPTWWIVVSMEMVAPVSSSDSVTLGPRLKLGIRNGQRPSPTKW